MSKGRFLTQAQAEELYALAAAFAKAKGGLRDVYDCLPEAIEAATVRPGDAGFCKGCRDWDYQVGGPYHCYHPDYREGYCPKEAK